LRRINIDDMTGYLDKGGSAMSRQVTSSEQLFRIYERGFVKRLGRDWRVFRYLWRIFWLWLTVGGKLRRAKREAARTGRVFTIDHIAGGGEK
jgi:hypothetical protein